MQGYLHTVFSYWKEWECIMTERNDERFGTIARQLVRFSLPLMFSGVLQQLYNWADAFIVGNVVGELALAAVGSTTSMVNFYVLAITGFTLGLAILFAQKFGAGRLEDIRKILATYLMVLGSVFLVLAGLEMGFTGPLLRLLHTTDETIALAEDYLRIVLAGVPFLAVYNVYSAALRGLGNSKAPFCAVLLSSVVNVVLDIVLVAGLHTGVAGAAAATVIAQAAMTVFLVGYSIRCCPLLRFRPGRQVLSGAMLVQGFRFGFPPMLQSSVSSAGSLILQNFMNGFGTATVAAVTTAYRVDSIVMVPIINLGSGISTLVAQDCGAGRPQRAGRIFGVGTALMAVVSLLLTVLVIPTGGDLIALFGAGDEAIAIGDQFFRRIACFYVIYGLAMAVRSYLEGMGDVAYSSLAGMAALVCRILLSYTLVEFFANMVIAYAEAFSWVLLLLLYLLRAAWKEHRWNKETQFEP